METDTRVLTTEVKLQRAFVKLLADKGFDRLTVRDLAREAAINRGTFYQHYLDKFDLLTSYENELVGAVQGIFTQYPKPMGKLVPDQRDAFWQLFQYLYHQRALSATLLRCPASKIGPRLKALIVAIVAVPVDGEAAIPQDIAQEIVVQGVLDFIRYWLTRDVILSPQRAYAIFKVTRTLSPQQLVGDNESFSNNS